MEDNPPGNKQKFSVGASAVEDMAVFITYLDGQFAVPGSGAATKKHLRQIEREATGPLYGALSTLEFPRGADSTMITPQAEDLNPDATTQQQPNSLPKPPIKLNNPKYSRRPSTRKGYAPKTREISALLKASFENNDNPDNTEIERIIIATGMGRAKVKKYFSDKRMLARKHFLLLAEAEAAHDEVQDLEMSESTRSPTPSTIEGAFHAAPVVQREDARLHHPGLNKPHPYANMNKEAILKSMQGDIDHEKIQIQVLKKDMVQMEVDPSHFADILEDVSFRRVAHEARIAGLAFMLGEVSNLPDVEGNENTAMHAGILADPDIYGLYLSTPRELVEPHYQSIVSKLKDRIDDASNIVDSLEVCTSLKSLSLSTSQLRGYELHLVEWRARMLVYRLALVSCVARYYDSSVISSDSTS